MGFEGIDKAAYYTRESCPSILLLLFLVYSIYPHAWIYIDVMFEEKAIVAENVNIASMITR